MQTKQKTEVAIGAADLSESVDQSAGSAWSTPVFSVKFSASHSQRTAGPTRLERWKEWGIGSEAS